MAEMYSRNAEWKDILSPALFMSIALMLFCRFVLSPILASAFIPEDKLKKLGPKKALFHTYLGSLVHAVEAVVLSGYILLSGEMGKDRIFSVTPNSITAMHITLGFSIADLLICLLDSHLRSTYSFIIHHSCMVAGISMGLYHHLYIYFIVYRFLNELSTPFVDWRAVIYEVGDKNGKWYFVACTGMTFSFFLCRIIVIPWHSYVLFSDIFSAEASIVPWYLNVYMIVNYTAFDALNVYWFYKILKAWFKFVMKRQRMD